MLLRIFSVPPNEIYEHPPELPMENIPEGPIEGYDCYAQSWGGHSLVIKCKPVVAYRNGLPYIEVTNSDNTRSDYWFSKDARHYNRPCWYQSGRTLRFIKERK